MTKPAPTVEEHHFTNRLVTVFLESNLSMILILLATVVGFTALWLTPREEDPQPAVAHRSPGQETAVGGRP